MTLLPAVDLYQKEMHHRFEELRLCEGGWKANQIAFDYYWSWRAGKEKSGNFDIKAKMEPPEDDNRGEGEEEPEDARPPIKRPKPTPVTASKKRRSTSPTAFDDPPTTQIPPLRSQIRDPL